jgi:hypothetical protein
MLIMLIRSLYKDLIIPSWLPRRSNGGSYCDGGSFGLKRGLVLLRRTLRYLKQSRSLRSAQRMSSVAEKTALIVFERFEFRGGLGKSIFNNFYRYLKNECRLLLSFYLKV